MKAKAERAKLEAEAQVKLFQLLKHAARFRLNKEELAQGESVLE